MAPPAGVVSATEQMSRPADPPRHAPVPTMRIAIIVNMVAPYTAPLFTKLAQREECELLVVSETLMERDRAWMPETNFGFEHALLDSWTLDLAPLAIGSGFKTRFNTYFYVPKRPLAPLRAFSPDVVVAGGGGIWSSPANIAALAARRWRDWAFVPWWGSFSRPRPTLPRRLADPWVRTFMRTSDAWLVYGTRQARDVVELGADPARTVIAPITPIVPQQMPKRPRPARGSSTRFLYVGRFIEQKGLDVLLDAFARVDGGELWLVGDGPLRGVMDAAAARDPRIRTLGHLHGPPLEDAYRETDVLVLPSLYEPWGLVVHEGLAHGLPVIVTDQVGAGEALVEHGTNGFVVPTGSAEGLVDAMRTISAWAPEQWQRAAARSQETLEAASIERGVEGFVQGCAVAVQHRRRLRESTQRVTS
jgi:glycosyltransferase involved in cell wall biosynthesis